MPAAYNPLAYRDPAEIAQNYLAQKQQQFSNNLATRQDARAQGNYDAQQVAAEQAQHDALIKQHAQQIDAVTSYVLQQPEGQAKAYVEQQFPDFVTAIQEKSGKSWADIPEESVRQIADTLSKQARASMGISAPNKMLDVQLPGGAIGQRDPQTNALTVPYKPPADTGFSLNPGEVRFDSTGKRIASVAPRPAAPAGGAGGLAPDASTNAADVAKQIANYQIPPLGAFALRTPWGQQVMAEVGRINPEYNANEFSARKAAFNQFASGKLGNQVRSFNVALSHLDTLSQAATALGNGDVQGFNRVSQFFAQQTGSEAPTNFDAMKKVVGDELVKSIVGSGGGVADREEVAHTLSRVSSPSQLAGVISSYQKLMGGQLGGLRRQYEHSTGRKDFESLLSPEAIPYLQTHEAQGTSGPKPPQAGETAAQRAARLGIK